MGERLRDIYPFATKWEVFKWKMRKVLRLVVSGMVMITALYCAGAIGSLYFPKVVYQAQAERVIEKDNFSHKIEELKNEIVEDLRACESAGHEEEDGIIIFDSNNKASIGTLQFQKATVIHYYKVLYGKDITPKEAVIIALDNQKSGDLAKDIIFQTKNMVGKDWVNCNKKLGLDSRVMVIKKLEQ